MTQNNRTRTELPPEQEAIWAKCFHPTGTFVDFPKEEVERSIAARFETIVASYSDLIAIKTLHHALTYDELNEEANRIAHAILALRSIDEKPIALLLEHDAPLITTILAVLKAGKIYVPLDPSSPMAQITSTLKDAQPELIVTDTRHLAFAQALVQKVRHVLNIDEIDARLNSENLGLSLSPDTPAYILYTSGSTGQPKGVLHNHRNVLHRVMCDTNVFHVCASDRLSLLSSCASNASVGDIFGALLNGATLCPFSLKNQGLVNMVNWLIQEEITIYHSVPTLFRHVCGAMTGKEQFSTLRLICLGGESVYKRDVHLYKTHFSSNCIFANLLGITETHNITVYVIDKSSRSEGSLVPAGYPFEDKSVVLRDDNGETVVEDHIGEIAIRSRYLSPGYWNRPDLTQSKFLADASGGSDEHIYLTGDLGRMSPDGCLLHRGRKDFQVKIRGNRVEIPEVEMALLALNHVNDAVVVGADDVAGNKRLVAYIVPGGGAVLTVGEIRRALAETLPEYMIPSVFIIVEKLPMTGNGKIDRLSLPEPGRSRPDLNVPFVPAKTPVEKELARIWAEVLSLDAVGIHDSFFELGGHSLVATRVVAAVIKTFQLKIPLQSLLQSPTVAEMAALITRYQGNQLQEKQVEKILDALESLTDEDAERLLSEQTTLGQS